MEGDALDRVERLEREVTRLRDDLAALRAQVSAKQARPSVWSPPTPTPAPISWPAPARHPAEAPKDDRRPDVSIDSETVLKWGGVGLVVLAVGFAVSTAISRGWIGPELQLAGALVVGLGLIGVGLRVRSSRPAWTHALCSGGVLALFTTFASDLFLDHAPIAVALGATTAVAAGGLVLAHAIRSEWLAIANLIGGAIGWSVIANGEPPVGTYVTWHVIFVMATIAIGVKSDWMAVRPTGLLVGMIATVGIADLTHTLSDRLVVGVATLVFATALVVVPNIGDLSSPWQQLEVQIAAIAAPWAFAVTFVSTLEPRSDRAIAFGAFAITAVTIAVTLALRHRLQYPHVISLLLGASITTSIGLAVLLSTSSAFVALAVQGAGLVILSRALDGNTRVAVNASVLLAIAGAYVLPQMIDAWETNAGIGDDLAHFAIIAAIGIGAQQSGHRAVERVGAVVVLGLLLVWLGSALVHLPQGQAVVSVAWAAVGTTVFLIGVLRKRAEAAAVGLAVIGLTVGKLLTVDLREVDTLWRAALFFGIGVGLLRLGFLVPRLTPDEEDSTDVDTDTNVADPPS